MLDCAGHFLTGVNAFMCCLGFFVCIICALIVAGVVGSLIGTAIHWLNGDDNEP